MAEVVARQLASDIIEPASAGLSPLGQIAPLTEQVLLDNGYSIEGLNSKPLTRQAIADSNILVNISGQPLEDALRVLLLDADAAPTFDLETWDIEDPYGAHPSIYQRILVELESRVLLLASRLRLRQRAFNS